MLAGMVLRASDPLARAVRVFLDGEDVTDRCFRVDTIRQEVGLYLLLTDRTSAVGLDRRLNPQEVGLYLHRPFILRNGARTGEVATETRIGRVELALRSDWLRCLAATFCSRIGDRAWVRWHLGGGRA